jgi:hypothetical protein
MRLTVYKIELIKRLPLYSINILIFKVLKVKIFFGIMKFRSI